MQFNASELNKTNQILMELPLFQNLLIEKEELEEQVKMLKHNIMYFESANRKILRKVEKLKIEIKSLKKSKKTKVVKETSAGSDSCFATLEEEDDDEVVFIKQEKIFEPVANNTIVIDLCKDDEPAIKMVIEEPGDEDNEEEVIVEEEEGEEETEEVVEVEGEEEEEVEIVETVDEGEEEEEVEIVETVDEGKEETEEEEVEIVEEGEEETEEVVEVETSAGSDSCKATLEGEEEEEVEIVETEEVVEEGDEEAEVVEVEGEEEEDVYEIEINGKTYYVSNEKNSVIYAADEDGEITIEAGVYKNGKPIFN